MKSLLFAFAFLLPAIHVAANERPQHWMDKHPGWDPSCVFNRTFYPPLAPPSLRNHSLWMMETFFRYMCGFVGHVELFFG